MNLLQASKCVNTMQKHRDCRRQPAEELGELQPPNEKMLKLKIILLVEGKQKKTPRALENVCDGYSLFVPFGYFGYN